MKVCLHPEMLRLISCIAKSGDQAPCMNNGIFDSSNTISTKQVMETVDCSIFWSVITVHSTHTSTSFMNLKSDLENFGQTVTLHRAKDYFLLNNFNLLQYSVIKKQYQRALNALNEKRSSKNI